MLSLSFGILGGPVLPYLLAAAAAWPSPPAGAADTHRRGVAVHRGVPATIERTAYLMGTLLRVRVVGEDRTSGDAAVGAAFDEVARLEAVLSTWSPSSDLGLANAAPVGREHPLSGELFGLVMEAASWVDRTDGAFDPAIGALIDAWDLRGAGRRPPAGALLAARAASGWSNAVLAPARQALVRPHPAWWLDSGGFGKGAALRSAAAVLRAHGVDSFTLDFGGQLVQHDVEGAAARIEVAHPIARTAGVAALHMRTGSVATSGASERFVEHDGERLGHILDPRSGVPVGAWGSVTVVADDALEADVLSTALFVMGVPDALAWATDNPQYGVLILRAGSDGRLCAQWNATMERWLVEPPAHDRGACGQVEDR